jgi:RNA polymerase sigma factor (TIGR02999 family)
MSVYNSPEGSPLRNGHLDQHDTAALFRSMYDRLRALARQRMGKERRDHTLQPTALVHEAFLRLMGNGNGNMTRSWTDPSRFYAAMAEAMRHVLVDAARRRRRIKRGGEALARMNVDELPVEPAATSEDRAQQLLAIDEALERLSVDHPKKAELVKLHYFGGLTLSGAAQALGISASTADRHWAYARAWLYRQLTGRDNDAGT